MFIWEKFPGRTIMQRPRGWAKPGVFKEQEGGHVAGNLEENEVREVMMRRVPRLHRALEATGRILAIAERDDGPLHSFRQRGDTYSDLHMKKYPSGYCIENTLRDGKEVETGRGGVWGPGCCRISVTVMLVLDLAMGGGET